MPHFGEHPGRPTARFLVSDRSPADYVTDGVNDEVQIQAAIDALTAGRTTKEVVKLKGNFNIADMITLPSYTVLDMRGAKLTLVADGVAAMLYAYSLAGVSYIDVIGGILDGNGAVRTAGIGLQVDNCQQFRVIDVIARRTKDQGFRSSGTALHGTFRGCKAELCYGTYAYQVGSAGLRMVGCIAVNNFFYGFYITQGETILDTSVAFDNGYDGFYLTSGASLSNCFSASNGRHGFDLSGADQAKLIGCVGNDSDSAAHDGFFLANTDRARLIGCTGARVAGFNQRYGLNISAADCLNTRVVDCHFEGNVTAALNDVGVNTLFKRNYGINPIGIIATPFDNVNNYITHIGAAAGPLAGVTYTIHNTDIKLTSTDSGNADATLTIRDPAGVAICAFSGADFPVRCLYIPHDYQIDWGAFTGAAPTVTVSFT